MRPCLSSGFNDPFRGPVIPVTCNVKLEQPARIQGVCRHHRVMPFVKVGTDPLLQHRR